MKTQYLLLCAVGLFLVAPGSLSAGPIDPGYDYLTTPPGTATLDLTAISLGIVPLNGLGIQGTTTDTIVHRMAGLPDGGTGPIPVEIVALSLQSVAPVTIGTSFFDVFVTIDAGGMWLVDPAPQPLPPSPGTLTVTSHAGDGGTFDSFFDVFADITFTEVGNPGNTFHQQAPQVHITSTGSTWSHSLATDPTMGGFAPGPITHSGPHPQTNPAVGPFPQSIPEPSSLVLGLLAVLGLGLVAVRKRRTPHAA
jgi:hypothetical protein